MAGTFSDDLDDLITRWLAAADAGEARHEMALGIFEALEEAAEHRDLGGVYWSGFLRSKVPEPVK